LIFRRSDVFITNISCWRYLQFVKIKDGIKSIKTSLEAHNMNVIAERFVGSVRREVAVYTIITLGVQHDGCYLSPPRAHL